MYLPPGDRRCTAWCHLDRVEGLGQEVHGDDLSLGLVLGLKVLDPLPGPALGLVEQVPAGGGVLVYGRNGEQ